MNGKEMKKIRLYVIHLCVLTFDFETLPMFYLNVFNEYTAFAGNRLKIKIHPS